MPRFLARLVVLWVVLGCCLAFGRTVTVSWTADGMPNHKVYFSQSFGGPWTLAGSTATSSFAHQHVAPGGYYYTATTLDINGIESAQANPVFVTVWSNCDLNADGNVNALDYQVMTNVILYGITKCPKNPLNTSVQLSCDVNVDGNVNVLDSQKITNVILGTGTCPF